MEIKYDNDTEKHTFGKILGIAAAVVPEDKEIQALIEKIVSADAPKFVSVKFDKNNNIIDTP